MPGIIRPNGVAPRLSPSHVGGRGVLFSGVALRGNFLNILTGQVGAVQTGTAGMHAQLGMTFSVAAGGAPTGTRFTSIIPTTDFPAVTCAAIFLCDALSSTTRYIIATHTAGGGGVALNADGSNNLDFTALGVVVGSSGLPIAAAVPYFAVASISTAAVNFTLKNLSTGAIKQASIAAINPISSDGVVNIGGTNGGSPLIGSIAAAMYSSYALSLAEQAKWADSPWEFWYPDGS